MLLVITVVGFVISARSQRVIATNLGKVIDRRVANPCSKDGDVQTRKHKFEGCGFVSHCRQNIFLVKCPLKCTCRMDLA